MQNHIHIFEELFIVLFYLQNLPSGLIQKTCGNFAGKTNSKVATNMAGTPSFTKLKSERMFEN